MSRESPVVSRNQNADLTLRLLTVALFRLFLLLAAIYATIGFSLGTASTRPLLSWLMKVDADPATDAELSAELSLDNLLAAAFLVVISGAFVSVAHFAQSRGRKADERE